MVSSSTKLMSENCVIELEKGNYKKCLCFKEGCGLTLARTCRDPGATSAQWAVGGRQSTILRVRAQEMCRDQEISRKIHRRDPPRDDALVYPWGSPVKRAQPRTRIRN